MIFLSKKSRELRNNMTPQERKFWNIVRNRQFYGYRFLRQVVIGEYIADFVCKTEFIIIEIDGGQHNTNENIQKDVLRTKYLENLGYRVLRFWNTDIDNNIEGVYEELKRVFNIS